MRGGTSNEGRNQQRQPGDHPALDQDSGSQCVGETLVVASSHGNKETEAKVNGKPVTIGVNAYVYR
jgi:hypothetical protein